MSAVAQLPLARSEAQAVADREMVIWHDLRLLSDVATDCTGPLAYTNGNGPFSLSYSDRFRAGERNLVLAQAWAKAAPADRPAIAAAFGKAFLEQLASAVHDEAVDDVELNGEAP
jgi:hypothetical protein